MNEQLAYHYSISIRQYRRNKSKSIIFYCRTGKSVMCPKFIGNLYYACRKINSPQISCRTKSCQTSVSEMKFVETPSPMEYKVNHPHKRYTGDFLLSAARRHFFKKRNKDSINSESLSDQTLSDANCCTDSRLYSNLTSKSLFFQFLCAALKHFFFEKFLDNMHIFTWKFEK